MLKVVFVLGCLLSIALAQPVDMEHKRLARSSSDSYSSSDERSSTSSGQPTPEQWLQFLYNIIRLQQTTPAPATTTTTAPTTTTTTAATTTTTTTAATTPTPATTTTASK